MDRNGASAPFLLVLPIPALNRDDRTGAGASCLKIARTRHRSGAFFNGDEIDGGGTLVDLPRSIDPVGRIFHQLYPLTDPARLHG
jgi:hypothetical protein